MKVAEKHIVKAMWAYSELRSPRFVDIYRGRFPDAAELIAKATSGVRFETLTASEVDQLARFIEVVREPFVRGLNGRHGGNTFVCESWNEQQLGRALTVHGMSPSGKSMIPFEIFASLPADPDRGDSYRDPRRAADRYGSQVPLVQIEPATALLFGSKRLLIDGYFRGILFYRHMLANQRLRVWVPRRAKSKRRHRLNLAIGK